MLFVSLFIGVNPSTIGDRRANEVEIVFPSDSNEGFHAIMTTFKNDLIYYQTWTTQGLIASYVDINMASTKIHPSDFHY